MGREWLRSGGLTLRAWTSGGAAWGRPRSGPEAGHGSRGRSETETTSPACLPPSSRFGTGSSVPWARSRQTLVAQGRPSMFAVTGVRPHAWVAGGAYASGMRANIHPPGPGYRHSRARNVFPFGLLLVFAFGPVFVFVVVSGFAFAAKRRYFHAR
jgi:hypothetical protein